MHMLINTHAQATIDFESSTTKAITWANSDYSIINTVLIKKYNLFKERKL